MLHVLNERVKENEYTQKMNWSEVQMIFGEYVECV